MRSCRSSQCVTNVLSRAVHDGAHPIPSFCERIAIGSGGNASARSWRSAGGRCTGSRRTRRAVHARRCAASSRARARPPTTTPGQSPHGLNRDHGCVHVSVITGRDERALTSGTRCCYPHPKLLRTDRARVRRQRMSMGVGILWRRGQDRCGRADGPATGSCCGACERARPSSRGRSQTHSSLAFGADGHGHAGRRATPRRLDVDDGLSQSPQGLNMDHGCAAVAHRTA